MNSEVERAETIRAVSGHSLNITAFDTLTADSAYWIGFLMADGCICHNTLSLELQVRDIEHLHKFRNFVGGTQKINTRIRVCRGKEHELASYHASSVYMKEGIAKFGILPNKSLTALAVKELEFNRHFWRGCIDGDGSVGVYTTSKKHINGKVYKGKAASLSFVGSDFMVYQFCSFIKKVYPKSLVMPVKKGKISTVKITHKAARTVIKFLYENSAVSLDRKQTIANDIISKAA